MYKSRKKCKAISFTQLLLDRQANQFIKTYNNTHKQYYSTNDRLNCLKASKYFTPLKIQNADLI